MPSATPTTPVSPTPSPTPRPVTEESTDPPPRPLPTSDLVVQHPRIVPNARRAFWVVDGTTGGLRQVNARLRTQTAQTAMWVEQGLWHDVRALETAAEEFETEVFTPTSVLFGSGWWPGIDSCPRIQILHATSLGGGIRGYASTRDQYPASVHPRSNQADLIVVNSDEVEVGSSAYLALLARELTRLTVWHQDRNEAAWIREGLVELGTSLTGAGTESIVGAYAEQPDVSLARWTNTEAQRGASYLLTTYLHQRFGADAVRALSSEPANGTRGFSAALNSLDAKLSFDQFFGDWLASTYLAASADGGVEGGVSEDLEPGPLTASAVYTTYPVTGTATVNQLGADFVVLHGDKDLAVVFEGRQETPLLTETAALEGLAWWSNSADESLAVLTRTLDLADIEEAAITYRAWYDIERDYDYVALEVSEDAGANWQVLRTPSGTGSDPQDNNPGWGYTGSSAGWIEEEVDLGDYAGETIQVRFSYLTDAAFTGDGFVLDEIVVRRGQDETTDPVDLSRWNPGGFVLTDGNVPQTYTAVLITLGDTTETESLSVDPDNTAQWTIPLGRDDVDEAILVLSARAPFTRQPAAYRLHIRAAESDPQSGAEERSD